MKLKRSGTVYVSMGGIVWVSVEEIEVHPEYLIDEMEQLDDIQAYDAAKSDEEYIPFEQAINEIKDAEIKHGTINSPFHIPILRHPSFQAKSS